MWKKEDGPDQPAIPRPEAVPSYERTAPPRTSGERATIGRSITIQGEVTGDEDLLVQGRVDGSVNLKQHSVTVGPEGEVKANITGRVVTVEGRVEGNLIAEEQVILRSSAIVEGDITAPRVVLEDGARFRGGVDMGENAGRAGRPTAAPQHGTKVPETARTPGVVDVASRGSAGEEKGGSGRKEGASDTSARITR